jgi:thiol-disulfide isomerase/thioredoxin
MKKDLNPITDSTPIKNNNIKEPPITINIPPTINIAPTKENILSAKSPTQTVKETYQFKTIKGQNITVKITDTGFIFPQYSGKVVLLQFFGKKCKYCFEEMPIINRIRSEYGNKLQVIAIQSEEKMTPVEASSVISQHNMNYPIIEKEVAVDLLVFLREKYEWLGTLPYLLLIKDDFMQSTGTSYETLKENIDDM